MECPVCLEPLSGTVVHLGCCNNQVHIQCYLPKCPLCRAELPVPRPVQPTHTIVPVPVTFVEQNQQVPRRVLVINMLFGFALLGCGYAIFVTQKP
jgi:hypothetical protein